MLHSGLIPVHRLQAANPRQRSTNEDFRNCVSLDEEGRSGSMGIGSREGGLGWLTTRLTCARHGANRTDELSEAVYLGAAYSSMHLHAGCVCWLGYARLIRPGRCAVRCLLFAACLGRQESLCHCQTLQARQSSQNSEDEAKIGYWDSVESPGCCCDRAATPSRKAVSIKLKMDSWEA